MKIIKYIIVGLIGLAFGISTLIAYGQLRILTPSQGGTGIGSATAGQVGNCLSVSDNSPFTYTLGTCGSGSGGGVGWATTTSDNESIYFYGKNYVGIGIDTPTTLSSSVVNSRYVK